MEHSHSFCCTYFCPRINTHMHTDTLAFTHSCQWRWGGGMFSLGRHLWGVVVQVLLWRLFAQHKHTARTHNLTLRSIHETQINNSLIVTRWFDILAFICQIIIIVCRIAWYSCIASNTDDYDGYFWIRCDAMVTAWLLATLLLHKFLFRPASHDVCDFLLLVFSWLVARVGARWCTKLKANTEHTQEN